MRPQRNEMADFNLSGFERQSNRKLFLTLLCSPMSLLLLLRSSFFFQKDFDFQLRFFLTPCKVMEGTVCDEQCALFC